MSEVVFSGANNVVYDDASTRDVTLSLLQSGSSLSSPSGFSSIDKIVESNENKFNFTPERHSSPVQFDTSLEHMTSDTRPGHESFLTSLESVTSLTNVTSTGEDFGCFEGGYPFQQSPPEQNTIEEYVLGSNQIAYNQSDRLNPNHLLQELTNSNGHQFEQGFPGQEAADGNSAPLWRPTVYESSALQNYNDQQQNVCHSNPLVSPNQSQRGPDTSDHVIDLTESVTSLDDDSNSSGSIQSIYCSVPDTATPNHNYELYSRHGDSFHEEPYPVEYYSQQCGSAAPSYSHVVSSQPPVDKPYYQQPSFPDTYPHRSAPNVFEVAVAENSTTWGQPPTALISQEELNMKIPNHSESDQSGSDTPALVAPTMTLHDGLAAESQFARKRPTIELSNRELWLKFFELGTEMIITKAGRRMFPAVKLNIRDLDPNKNYALAIEILPVDNNRYRYVYHSSQWMAAGTTEASTQPCTYFHPDSPSRGDLWMRQPISFDKLKLTNYEMNRKGHVILHSMHKYQPRIHLIECHTNRLSELESLLSTTNDVPSDDVTTVVFPECAFTTVTAYQNQQITKLKIDRNPFAKGFRDSNKQWKQKTTAEKTNKVWSRHGESPHGHTATIPNTIDLGNAQHNNNPHQLQQFQHNSVNQFTQGPVYNNNLNQQSDEGLTITHSLLAKTITNNSTGPNIFHTPSFQHQQPKHNDVITPCASNRDDSMTSRQEVSDFIPFSIYSNIPFQREQRNPAGSNDFANFTPSGGVGGLEVGLDALLYPEHAQQVTAAFDKQHQPLCSEP